ncbi:ATP-binding cassette domain-containing protein [Candidatus Peregrinibacteria bacterium]|nr:ATP-binding cassette domain-containing protein [Candidatus Peregrinibacteria bacterium]
MMQDPVCGMKLDKKEKIKHVYNKKTYYFCSKDCKDEFKKNPKKFLKETPVIELRDIYKDYHLGETRLRVLKDLSMNIWEGDFVVLIGVSGSGKSTVMNLIGCLDTPTKGKVYIDGKEVSKMSEDRLANIRNEKIGFVFQQFNLLGALNCRENVSLPLFFKKGSKAFKPDGKVKKYLKSVGLLERAEHKPLEMSGGEQQRAAIARALVDEPEVILADEPTGNLDSKTGKMIMRILEDLNEKGKTIIVVTHDPSISKAATRIMNLKDGRLIGNHKNIIKIIWSNKNNNSKK